jgi:hypothetical protein
MSQNKELLRRRLADQKDYACSYQPALSLEHFITKNRLTSRYLFELVRGMGRSYVRLECVLGRSGKIQRINFVRILIRLVYRCTREGFAGIFIWAWDLGYKDEAAKVSE